MSAYRERVPVPALRAWVECAWERTSDGDHRVLPDGCIDIVHIDGDELHVVGANSTAFTTTIAAGGHAAGVRFHPGAAPAVLGRPGDELLDTRPGVAELWGDDGLRLQERVALAPEPERTRLLLDWVARRAGAARRPDPVVARAVQLLAAPARSRDVARELAISERQLRRRFAAAVGYGPKRLARVLRLQRALALARADAGAELAAVAAVAGYADQAHFTNDCVDLAGLSPARLLARR